MKVIKTLFGDVKYIEMPRFEDDRGSFTKTFEALAYREAGIELQIREMYYSVSAKNVIRGMHFQAPPAQHAKYVYVLRGEVLDVVLDLRRESPDYGKAAGLALSAENHRAVYIPSGFAHGFRSLRDGTVMQYMVTSEHSPGNDKGVRWDSFGFDWGVRQPVVSERDKALPALDGFTSPF